MTFSALTLSYAIQFNEENTRNAKTKTLVEMRICASIAAPEQMRILFRCFPKTKIYTLYGQTESGTISMFSKFSDSLAKVKLTSCGVPCINSKIKVSLYKTDSIKLIDLYFRLLTYKPATPYQPTKRVKFV